jgi:hypothetical protein
MTAIANIQASGLSSSHNLGQIGVNAYSTSGGWTYKLDGTWTYLPNGVVPYSTIGASQISESCESVPLADWQFVKLPDVDVFKAVTVSPEIENVVAFVESGQQQDMTIPERPSKVIRRDGRRFEVLQQWEGIVTDLEGDVFVAILRDLTDRTSDDEIAEIFLAEVPDADHPILKEGSAFYWIIGFEYKRGGQKSRVSEIRVRRTPEWTIQKIERVKKRAAERFQRARPNG